MHVGHGHSHGLNPLPLDLLVGCQIFRFIIQLFLFSLSLPFLLHGLSGPLHLLPKTSKTIGMGLNSHVSTTSI